jgi:hypothetical protein
MCNNNNEDLHVTKLTPDGEFVWQTVITMWNSDNNWSLAVTDNGDILVAGRGYINEFDNHLHRYNHNYIIVKFDRDGNLLFSRALWSNNGMNSNWTSEHSNSLSVNGDRFSLSTYSNDPGDGNDQGTVVDLPLDGTGTGAYGDFHYDEIELNVNWRFTANNDAGGHLIVTSIDTLIPRAHSYTSVPYTGENYYKNVTAYGDQAYEIQKVYEPGGAEIKGVAKITFEDGTVQTTSGQGLPQVKPSQTDGGGNYYWVRPEDNGKHIYQNWGGGVIIPSRDQVDLPIGFAFTIITDNSESGVFSWDYDEDIYLSGGDGTNDRSYYIPYHSMVTLVKIRDGRWMIAGPGLITGWW